MATEQDLIAWLRGRVRPHQAVALGMGDDAAVLAWSRRGDCVVTTDMLMEGVDFVLEDTDPSLVGRKALAVSLSDLAAMAARPVAAFVSLALPRQGGFSLAQRIYEGLVGLADGYGVALAGGDTNSWNGPLVIATTALGQPTVRGPLRRDGAKPGDWLLVTGQFGGSILGHHLTFQPRIEEALLLHGRYALHAGIDCSDGLARDLAHLAEESSLGAVLWEWAVPISSAARELAGGDEAGALHRALTDGEDFELILSVAEEDARRILTDQPLAIPVSHVGQFVRETGLWRVKASGDKVPLAPGGYQHQL